MQARMPADDEQAARASLQNLEIRVCRSSGVLLIRPGIEAKTQWPQLEEFWIIPI